MKYHHAETKEKILTQSFIRVIFLWVTFLLLLVDIAEELRKGSRLEKKRKDRRSRKCTTYCTVGKCGHFSYSMKNRTHIFSGSKCIKNVKFWNGQFSRFEKLLVFLLLWSCLEQGQKKRFSAGLACRQERENLALPKIYLPCFLPSSSTHTHVVTSLALLSLLYPLATKSSLKSSKAVSRRKLRSSSSTTTLWDNPFLHMVLKLEKKLKESSRREWDTH